MSDIISYGAEISHKVPLDSFSAAFNISSYSSHLVKFQILNVDDSKDSGFLISSLCMILFILRNWVVRLLYFCIKGF